MENSIEVPNIKEDKRYPRVGELVHYHIYSNKIKKADISRGLGILPKGLTAYFKRDSLQFEIIWKMSLIMKHNFVAQLAEFVPYHYETLREKKLQEQLAEKEALIQKMEIQLEVYRDLLKK